MNIYNITKIQLIVVVLLGITSFYIGYDLYNHYKTHEKGQWIMVISAFITLFYYVGWVNNLSKKK